MREACKYCKFCKDLYFPPSIHEKAKHERCCILFLSENSVTYLGNDVLSLCECFTENNNNEDFTDHLLNMGFTKGYAKGIDDLIAKAKEYYERYRVMPSQMALKELGRILKGE